MTVPTAECQVVSVDSSVKFNSLFVKFYVLAASLAIGIGLAFVIGGEARFSGPSFVGPRNLVGWLPLLDPHMIWGLVFVLHGLVLVFSMGRRFALKPLRGGVALYLFLVLSFIQSVAVDARAAASGIVAYAVIAAMHLVLADHLAARGWEGC